MNILWDNGEQTCIKSPSSPTYCTMKACCSLSLFWSLEFCVRLLAFFASFCSIWLLPVHIGGQGSSTVFFKCIMLTSLQKNNKIPKSKITFSLNCRPPGSRGRVGVLRRSGKSHVKSVLVKRSIPPWVAIRMCYNSALLCVSISWLLRPSHIWMIMTHFCLHWSYVHFKVTSYS